MATTATPVKDFFSSFLLGELFKGMALTGRHFWSRKITVQFPEEKTPLSPRFRGLHALRRYENGEELRLDQQPDGRARHEAHHQRQRGMHRVARDDDAQCRDHQDRGEQPEQTRDQHHCVFFSGTARQRPCRR